MLADRHYCASTMLLSLLMLCPVQILARNLRGSDIPVVKCDPTDCSQPCPTLMPICPSKLIRSCGCCDVCWILRGEGDTCDSSIPENVACSPGMQCNDEGQCEAIPLEENASSR